MTVERSILMTQPSSAVYVEDVFSTYLYTGTGASQTITNNIDLSTKGGLVWIKERTAFGNQNNWLTDTLNGAGNPLSSNLTNGSAGPGFTAGVSSFATSGFSVGTASSFSTSATYASWTFRKQAKFFDVVTYTGNGVAGRTVAHSLGATPGMIIVKRTNAATNWFVYHTSVGATKYLTLNLTDVPTTSTFAWNNTSPTASVFTVGSSLTNVSGGTYVAYLFADSSSGGFGSSGTDSVVACGSFTKDGSNNATVNLGWEPQWILVKDTTTTTSEGDNWLIADTMRGAAYSGTPLLRANTSDAEAAASYGGPWFVPTATGFQINSLSGGSTHIYLAIRRGPMKTPTDATKVFEPKIITGTGSNRTVTTSNVPVVDSMWSGDRDGANGGNAAVFDRLRGTGLYVITSSNSSETSSTDTLTGFDVQSGYKLGVDASVGYVNYSTVKYVDWIFRRAPGFFDVVCYPGTGSATTVAHNLGVAPELMIVKKRNGVANWHVYPGPLGSSYNLFLDTTDAAGTPVAYWNYTAPTSTVFSVGTGGGVNVSGGAYIAYLFATCPGVSKVGSYTGTAAALNIDCGFAAGARFVLIKRTDSTGDWYVYDSARGISSGDDPYLFLNSTAAEVTNTNYVDAYASGFSLTATAPAGLNANGGTYIYLAIA